MLFEESERSSMTSCIASMTSCLKSLLYSKYCTGRPRATPETFEGLGGPPREVIFGEAPPSSEEFAMESER